MSVDRRRFIQLSALGIVATVAEAACGPADTGDAAVDQPQLLTMLGAERVRQLGARYRTATPRENSVDALRAAISNGHRLRTPLIGTSIDEQVRDDFAEGRTVLVDGWVLSVTEARQCALFSLTRA